MSPFVRGTTGGREHRNTDRRLLLFDVFYLPSPLLTKEGKYELETIKNMQDESLIKKDIDGYLRRHYAKELLRFVTVGSVDDGKSTLIGRLLYDSGSVFDDQLAAIKKHKGSVADGEIDYSLLLDGLLAEREQGITIDVAYRYFSTDKRKFIIADTPGHVQYTRNMATGASNADLALILIDARLGILPQSKRHAYIASLLGIPHLVVCINKMDLVDYQEDVFNKIKEEFIPCLKTLGFESDSAIGRGDVAFADYQIQKSFGRLFSYLCYYLFILLSVFTD